MLIISETDAQVIRAALSVRFGSAEREGRVVWQRTDGAWTVGEVGRALDALRHMETRIREEMLRCLDPREFGDPALVFAGWLLRRCGLLLEGGDYRDDLGVMQHEVWTAYGMLALYQQEGAEEG